MNSELVGETLETYVAKLFDLGPQLRMKAFWRRVLVAALTGAVAAPTAIAQPVQNVVADTRAARFEIGVAAIQRGYYSEGISLLTGLFNEDPGLNQPDNGSAAYWLGYALNAVGDNEQAVGVWSSGIEALNAADEVDPLLTDSYVTNVYTDSTVSDFAEASDAYLELLRRSGEFSRKEHLCIIVRHLAQFAPLLPPGMRPSVLTSARSEACDGMGPSRGVGSFIVAWWQGRDPLLRTTRNERLELHLQRVAHARRFFADRRRASLMDDRGDIYVRFGAPAQVVRLARKVDNPLLRRADVARDIEDWADLSSLPAEGTPHLGLGDPIVVWPAGSPSGELWLYPHIHSSAHFFFLKEGRSFRLAQISELVPLKMRNFRGRHGRRNVGLVADFLFGDRMQAGIYRQLASVSAEFSSMLVAFESAKERAQMGGVDFSSIWMDLRSYEQEAAARRDRVLPEHHSPYDSVSELPVQFRLARFLDNDRTTRTEIYWQVQPPPPPALDTWKIHTTVVKRNANYETVTADSMSELIPRQTTREVLPDGMYILRGDTGMFHVAVQWSQFTTAAIPLIRADRSRPLPLLSAIRRLDSLQALTSSRDVLEMSDLLLVSSSKESSRFATERGGIPTVPYPPSTVSRHDTFALYFEVYNLTYGPEDSTRYSIEYKVTRLAPRGIWRLFRKDQVVTSSRRTNLGSSRREAEMIILPVEQWTDAITVSVEIIDLVSKNRVTRSIDIDVTS